MPTGFVELDEVTNGLHPGQMIIIAARPGVGKALALDTPLPTPTGWTTMGDVAVGDLLLGADGEPTRVVAATDIMLGRPCYEVEFSDGTVIVADAIAPVADRLRHPDHRRAALRYGHASRRRGSMASLRRARRHTTLMAPVLQIDAVRRVRSVPVRCVQVDNAAHLYLAGRGMVPTHNSTLGLDFLRSCSIKHQMASVIFSLGDEQVRDRDAAAVGRGEDQARRHAVGPDERRRLDAAGAADERDQRSAAVHRRLAEPDDDGDPGEGAAAFARRPG